MSKNRNLLFTTVAMILFFYSCSTAQESITSDSIIGAWKEIKKGNNSIKKLDKYGNEISFSVINNYLIFNEKYVYIIIGNYGFKSTYLLKHNNLKFYQSKYEVSISSDSILILRNKYENRRFKKQNNHVKDKELLDVINILDNSNHIYSY